MVGRKNEIAEEILRECQGRELAPHYLAYFELFNRQLFFEAHEVLEKIWLPQRGKSNGDFYKGLIQFAGAFVHLQKNRLRPAAALLRLARANMARYPGIHESLDVEIVLETIQSWLGKLQAAKFTTNPLTGADRPKLTLSGSP